MVAVNYTATTFLCKTLDIDFYLRYNNFTFQYAGIAQLVEQRIRNAQVACSSHVSSSRKKRPLSVGQEALSRFNKSHIINKNTSAEFYRQCRFDYFCQLCKRYLTQCSKCANINSEIPTR